MEGAEGGGEETRQMTTGRTIEGAEGGGEGTSQKTARRDYNPQWRIVQLEKARLQHEDCAKTALEFFNEQNPGAEFELVEAIQSNGFIGRNFRFWFHVSFTAKPKNAASGDSSPKYFFAELNHRRRGESPGRRDICRCSIVDSSIAKITSCCRHCNPRSCHKVYHVAGVFRHGLFKKPGRKRRRSQLQHSHSV